VRREYQPGQPPVGGETLDDPQIVFVLGIRFGALDLIELEASRPSQTKNIRCSRAVNHEFCPMSSANASARIAAASCPPKFPYTAS
jgi:hypothetical protein